MDLYLSCRLDRFAYIEALSRRYDIGIEINDFTEPLMTNHPSAGIACIDRYREFIGSNNLRRTLHGPFFDLILHATDEAFAGLSKNKIRAAVGAAAELGCEKIVFHSGYMPVTKSSDYLAKVIERQVSFWKQLCGEYPGLVFCLENMFETGPEFLLEIIECCAADNIRFCFDLAHAVVFSNRKPLYWLEKMARHLEHVHLSDCNGVFDEHLALGRGRLKIDKTIKYLQALHPGLSWTVEVSGEEKARESLEYLERAGFISRKDADGIVPEISGTGNE
ncbi:MAG: sugar phosphate isomerase/epimerase [Spirochaetales bacterium]|nr:sugar phosphate isomerase/epimerase [Spirochaetales bacterium]